MNEFAPPSADLSVFLGGGAVGALARAHDWSASPLGHPSTWPQSLRSVVGLLLSSKFPMFLAWGPELGFLYNDAYAEILGAKHPGALGRPFKDIWSEIWPDISPLIDAALAGQATYHEDLPLVVNRRGFDEQAWFTFSYSPVRDESGRISGMYCAVAETTERVLAEQHNASERERLARMFEQAPGFITILKGPEHVFDFANAAYRRLFGDRDFVGRSVREVFPDLAGQGFFDLLDQVYATGERFVARQVPIRLVRAPGAPPEQRILDFIYEPVTDEAGRITGIFCEGHDVTETHHAEMALRASEERYRAIVETATDYAIFTTDAEGRIETWPKGAEKVFGWSADEAIGQSMDMTFTPEDRAKGAPEIERMTAQATGHSPNVRWHLCKDGSRVFIDGVMRPLTGPDGSLAGFVKVGQDMTRRRRAEERLQLATEAAELGIFDVDFTTGRMEWDAHQRELWGIGLHEVITDEIFLAGVHPDERDRVQAVLARAFDPEGNGLYAAEYRLCPREDGSERWVAATGRVHFEGQRPVRLIGTVQDISARKRTEAALRESEARLSRALDAGELGAWELDLSTNVAWRSPQHDRIFGYDEMLPEWTYTMFLDHVVPEDRAEVDARFQAAIAERGHWDFECRIRRADGKLRWIWAQGRIDPASGGQPARMKGMVRDITARKRSEEALRELNDTLETRVAERTAELEAAHEQLRQSQKLEAMGQLTGGVAHDFNNLLTPIVASLDMLLRRGVGSERERRLMDGALQSAERAKTLVQRLLAFARRQPLQPRAVDVRELVSGMAELIASTSGPRIDVRVDLPDDLPPALADANQLEMAVLNLAVNARDAMPDGGVLTISAERVSVKTARRTKLRPGHYVRLSVKDTGLGMDEATLARAVEPFFSTKGIGKGTGLGLSMVHGLAMQLNGGLTITSRPGEGTTVELWLPISAVAAEEDGQAHGVAAAPNTQGTALLVDDEDLVRLSTADMLMDLGYEVVEASSAEEALRLVDEGVHPDLVVTDHLMPGMSGLDLARNLQSRRPDLPVLIVSGYAEMDGIAPGFPRLTKPFRAAELAAGLAALLRDGTR